MASASPKGKGHLDLPNPILLSVENTLSTYTKVLGKCSRDSGLPASGESEASVIEVVPDQGGSSSAFTNSQSIRMEGGLPDEEAKVSEVSYFGLTSDVVGSMGMGAEKLAPMTMGLVQR